MCGNAVETVFSRNLRVFLKNIISSKKIIFSISSVTL
jgi:hypothetical protein